MVRLEGDDDPAVARDLTRGPQGHLNLGRVVRVVVEHPDATDDALGLEAPSRAGEHGQSGSEIGERHAEAEADHDRRRRVQHVVHPRHLQGDVTESATTGDDLERRARADDLERLDADVGVCG